MVEERANLTASKALPLDGGGLGGGVAAPLAKEAWLAPNTSSTGERSVRLDLASTPIPGPSPIEGEGGAPYPDIDAFDRERHAPGAVSRARRQRASPTSSEARLWQALRKLKLNFRRQAPIGPYVVDFVQHAQRLVVEVDGGVHRLPEVQARDSVKTEWLKSQGYRVLRFSSDQAYLQTSTVIEAIQASLTPRTGTMNPVRA